MEIRLTINRRPVLWVLLILIICWLGIVGSAWGQSPRDEVRAKLEQTDQLLERARDVVAQMGGPRAHDMLAVGERLQRQAWDAFHAGRLKMADRMTEMARKSLLDLLGSFRQSEDNINEVERQLERTDRVLQDAHDKLGTSTGPVIARRLDGAAEMQTRAWELFRQQHLRPALNLTLQAREIVLNLAGRGPGMGPGHGPMGGDEFGPAFEPRFDRLRDAVIRVGEQVDASKNETARNMWNRAQQALDDARAAHDAGDDRRADERLRQTREFLDRAMRQIQREVRGEQVEVLISSAKERLDLMASPVQDAGEKRLKDWHGQAAADLEGAQAELANGRPNEALALTRKAVSLLDKIADELGL